jgi:hypothetical protein
VAVDYQRKGFDDAHALLGGVKAWNEAFAARHH